MAIGRIPYGNCCKKYEGTAPDNRLAIVISNLLENAINACRKLPETERYVKQGSDDHLGQEVKRGRMIPINQIAVNSV